MQPCLEKTLPDRHEKPGRKNRKVHIEAREQKICTIVFIDIVSSTALIEDLDPEEALDRLGPAVELIMDTCEEFGASVRFVGDGAMAAFGFPAADESHCLRAVEAGLTVVERIADMQEDRVDIRVGIHTGPVLFGNLSHTSFDELTLTGSVVHLADKIQSVAANNSVTVSPTVIEAVGEMFHVRELGETFVRGMDQPLRLFEIEKRNESVSRWKTRVDRGLSHFVGRKADLDRLQQAWARARSGAGAAVALVGEAGIGKSRLVHEFTAEIDQTAAEVLEFSATALDRQVAYAPISRTLGLWLDLPKTPDPARISQKLMPYLQQDSTKRARRSNALYSVLHSKSEDPAWVMLSPKLQQEAIVDALLAIFQALSTKKPLVLVFEDIHWTDQYTKTLVSHLVAAAPAFPLLVIVTSRTEADVPGYADGTIDKITLGPLDDASSRDLISNLLPRSDGKEDLSDFVDDICGQTPLFIEEIIRNLKSSGLPAVRRKGGGFKVPDSVQPLIAQRLDALPTATRQTLQMAAVIGSEFSVDLLRMMLRREGLEDDASLVSLAKLDLIENIEKPVAKFRHALIHQVTYSGLPKRRLRHLHGVSVDIIDGMSRGSDLATMTSLAFHAERSQRWVEAAASYVRCGHLAIERAAFDDAVIHFREALKCAEKVDANPHRTASIGIQARQGLRVALLPKADFTQIMAIAAEIESLSQQVGDDASALGASIDRTIMMTILSDLREAIKIGRQTLDRAIDRGAPGFIATAAFALSQAYWFRADYDAAVQIETDFGHLFTPENDRLNNRTAGTLSVLGTCTHANSLSLSGHLEDAGRVCEQVKALVERSAKPYDRAFGSISLGFYHLQRGDHAQSLDILNEAMKICEHARIEVLPAFLSAPRARAYAKLGQIENAHGALTAGYNIAIPTGTEAFHAQLLAAEVDIRYEIGELTGSEAIVGQLTRLCEKNGYDGLLRRVRQLFQNGHFTAV